MLNRRSLLGFLGAIPALWLRHHESGFTVEWVDQILKKDIISPYKNEWKIGKHYLILASKEDYMCKIGWYKEGCWYFEGKPINIREKQDVLGLVRLFG